MTKNIFLTKGANIEEMTKAMPKTTVASGFVVTDGHIEYVGNPKALKYVVPKMSAIVSTLKDFKEVRTKKNYMKNNEVRTCDIVTWTYKSEEDAQILCDNVNRLIKAEYEASKKSK